MKIIEGKKLFHNDMPLALSIGKFDGVHLGHRKILSALAARESEGLTPAVLTFDPSPEAWFTGQERVLTTREEKRYLLAQAGVGLLIELPFDRETADTDPAAFAENVLARQLSVRFIAAGPDLSFGAGGRGSFELLESMAGSLAFETQRVDKVQWDGAPISSTRIRGLVEEARMEEAAEMMGRAYLIRGRVEHGRQLGRTIGIPTANLIPPAEKILPPNGVYYSIVTLDGVTYDVMTSLISAAGAEVRGRRGAEGSDAPGRRGGHPVSRAPQEAGRAGRVRRFRRRPEGRGIALNSGLQGKSFVLL